MRHNRDSKKAKEVIRGQVKKTPTKPKSSAATKVKEKKTKADSVAKPASKHQKEQKEPRKKSRSRRRKRASPSSSVERDKKIGLEDELMKLSALKLVAKMKADIVARRLRSPDFKNGRLRAAYSKALEQLCEDGKG